MRMSSIAAAATMVLWATSADASLYLVGPEHFHGTGLGSASTILTMQSPSQTSNEAASVAWSGSSDVISGDANEQTRTRTLAELGVTSAHTLRVIFNANEPGGDTNSIGLDDLILSIFSPAGALLWSSGAFAPHLFLDTVTGIGNSGWSYALDATQAAAAQAAAFGGAFGDNRVGLSAAASLATDGHETFFVANAPVPEPSTLALIISALLGMGVVAKRRS